MVDTADELCRQLTVTISSLADDAEQLNLLASVNPNCSTSNALLSLDQALTNVERRVKALTKIVHGEKKALHQVESQRISAVHVNDHLTQLLQNSIRSSTCIGPSSHRTNNQEEETELHGSDEAENLQVLTQHQYESQQPYTPYLYRTGDTPVRKQGAAGAGAAGAPRTPASFAARRVAEASPDEESQLQQNEQDDEFTSPPLSRYPLSSTMDARAVSAQQLRIELEHVTLEELESIPRRSRGRISLPDINAALDDIVRVCAEKSNKRRVKEKPEFCLNPSKENDVVLPNRKNDQWVVGEQELRQSCSFFRTGESTARSILLILRTLGRLKQVPAKSGGVTYVVGR